VTKALVEQQGTQVLADLFAKDNLYNTDHKNLPNTDANQLVNFTGNHDMGRFAYSLHKSDFNYSEQAKIDRNLLAHAMMFFTRGVPVVYYGDEQGFVGDGGDQASRQDMMPSMVASYNDDDLLATDKTTADDNFDASHPLYQAFAHYADLYQTYPALRFGQQQVIYAQDKPGLFAITRDLAASNTTQGQQLVVVFNTATSTQTLKKAVTQKVGTLIYRSDKGTKPNALAPLSFAIYQRQ
jgi:glycosidase